MSKYTDGKKIVAAPNYQAAAEKLYGQEHYHNPAVKPEYDYATIPTTYVYVHNGYADVAVYSVGDKQGSYWGVQAAIPKRYVIRRI